MLDVTLATAIRLVHLRRFEEAKSLLRKQIPVAQRKLGDGHIITLTLKKTYAVALYCDKDPGAMLDNLREAVTTLEEVERTARRVLGAAHPTTVDIEGALRTARVALAVREAP